MQMRLRAWLVGGALGGSQETRSALGGASELGSGPVHAHFLRLSCGTLRSLWCPVRVSTCTYAQAHTHTPVHTDTRPAAHSMHIRTRVNVASHVWRGRLDAAPSDSSSVLALPGEEARNLGAQPSLAHGSGSQGQPSTRAFSNAPTQSKSQIPPRASSELISV